MGVEYEELGLTGGSRRPASRRRHRRRVSGANPALATLASLRLRMGIDPPTIDGEHSPTWPDEPRREQAR